MKEKRKYGNAALIYAIVGVIVLILAIAGSTFAFFTASATADTPIAGEVLDIDLGVSITKVSADGTKGAGLIPIHDGTNATSQLSAAATANCVDKNNYTACQIYKITLTNSGADATTVDTTIEFTSETMDNYKNLKWAPMTNASTMGTGTFKASTNPGKIFSDISLGATTIEQYVMIYINNTGADQTNIDSGTFTGTIKVTASTGAEVQASFGDDPEPLIQYISNLYTNANKTTVTNNGITYNYATSVSLMNDRLGGTTTSLDGGNIRYYGANPNNYIDIGDVYTEDTVIDNYEKNSLFLSLSGITDSNSCYTFFDCSTNYSNFGCQDAASCETVLENKYRITDLDDVCGTTTKKAGEPKLYRVIGMFKDIEKTDGTTQDLVKVIREDSIGYLAWDLTGTSDSDASYDNNWHNATLKTILNGAYYNGGSTTHYYYNLITDSYNFGNTIDFKKSGLNSIVHDKIETVVWNLGGLDDSDIYSNEIYGYERGNSKCTDCTYDTTWPGKIALAYPSDIGYAVDFTKCSETLYNYNKCFASDWMTSVINGNVIEWLLTPSSGSSDYAWYVGTGDVYYYYYVSGGIGARPVFYLDSELVIETGNGSKSTPFVVR